MAGSSVGRAHGQLAQRYGAAAAEAWLGSPFDTKRPRHPVNPLSRSRSLTAVDRVSVGVPASLTRFVGREQELHELALLLGETRLLTLTGAGGVGKTRLALELAARAKQFADGAYFVELASTWDPEIIPHAIGQALRLPGQTDRLEQLVRLLGDRRLLLVVDNCEQLIAACAALAEALLQACPQLVLLATSREPLGLLGETTWRVPSLSFQGSQRPRSTWASMRPSVFSWTALLRRSRGSN